MKKRLQLVFIFYKLLIGLWMTSNINSYLYVAYQCLEQKLTFFDSNPCQITLESVYSVNRQFLKIIYPSFL